MFGLVTISCDWVLVCLCCFILLQLPSILVLQNGCHKLMWHMPSKICFLVVVLLTWKTTLWMIFYLWLILKMLPRVCDVKLKFSYGCVDKSSFAILAQFGDWLPMITICKGLRIPHCLLPKQCERLLSSTCFLTDVHRILTATFVLNIFFSLALFTSAIQINLLQLLNIGFLI